MHSFMQDDDSFKDIISLHEGYLNWANDMVCDGVYT